jgi:hypothetical protein
MEDDMPDAPAPGTENAAPEVSGPVDVTADGGPPVAEAPPEPPAAAPAAQTSLAAPVSRGLSCAVDIVFCIDVTGSMDPIIDAVKTNALRFYDDVQGNLTAKGKNVDELRVRVIAFRDLAADGDAAIQESPFYRLPDDRSGFSGFVDGLIAEGAATSRSPASTRSPWP